MGIMKTRNPIPYTGKHRKHNPEKRSWRGISYKRGGRKRRITVRSMRDALITE